MNVPDAVEDAEHDSVLFDEDELSETLAGLSKQLRLLELPPDTAAVKDTEPVNPLRPITVNIEVPEVPAVTLTCVGLAAIAKSGAFATTNARVVE